MLLRLRRHHLLLLAGARLRAVLAALVAVLVECGPVLELERRRAQVLDGVVEVVVGDAAALRVVHRDRAVERARDRRAHDAGERGAREPFGLRGEVQHPRVERRVVAEVLAVLGRIDVAERRVVARRGAVGAALAEHGEQREAARLAHLARVDAEDRRAALDVAEPPRHGER